MVRFLRRGDADSPAPAEPGSDSTDGATTDGGLRVVGKGRPTPKRREAEARRRGPVAPPPKTQREAFKRSRGDKEQRRGAAAERRERMMSGDERFLPLKDRGPVKAYVRDIIDSRRNFMGLFMPLAVGLLLIMMIRDPVISQYVSLVFMAMIIAMIIEAVLLGFHVTRRVRARFPDAPDSGLGLGWYSFSRASQLRKLRIPRPRVTHRDRSKID